jgi:hypothetical protein
MSCWEPQFEERVVAIILDEWESYNKGSFYNETEQLAGLARKGNLGSNFFLTDNRTKYKLDQATVVLMTMIHISETMLEHWETHREPQLEEPQLEEPQLQPPSDATNEDIVDEVVGGPAADVDLID